MDKSNSYSRPAPPGLSIRHGPVSDQMDVDSAPNGTVKRKSRASTGQPVKYKEESDSDDGAPLVGLPTFSAGVSTDERGLTISGETAKIAAQKDRVGQRRRANC